MHSALLRDCLAVIETNPTPPLSESKIDKDTGMLDYHQMVWFADGYRPLRIYIFGNNNQVLLDHTRRLWVPLDAIRVDMSPVAGIVTPIGIGGHHCISINGKSVDGLKEAFTAALEAAEPAA